MKCAGNASRAQSQRSPNDNGTAFFSVNVLNVVYYEVVDSLASARSRMPDEVGLKLIKSPTPPREMPSSYFIRNTHGVRDWEMFHG